MKNILINIGITLLVLLGIILFLVILLLIFRILSETQMKYVMIINSTLVALIIYYVVHTNRKK